jgi:serine/threonine protein kinase
MLHAGDKLGPYSLVRTLGRGAFGEVWLAERATSLLTTQAALKLPFDGSSNLGLVRDEAQTWLKASGHPNVVPVLEAEVYDGQVIIASEYVAGGTLREWMERSGGAGSTVDDSVRIVSGILAGLDYLHRSGVTHRDLKPENVLMQHGVPRLTDFGLARVLKAQAHTETVSGTPRYMAPEAFSGSYSEATDLWAVGVMLHELLGGAHPFPDAGLMQLIAAIQLQEPAALPATVPERLRAVVARLLAKRPA